MMLNWDLAILGSRLLGRPDPFAADSKVAKPPQQGTIVAMPAKTIHGLVTTARAFERPGVEAGQ